MVGDSFQDHWKPRLPEWYPNGPLPELRGILTPPAINREEFDELKKEVQLLRDLLERALKYDTENGEPDCEQEEKVALLRAVAKAVGVELPI